MTAVIPDAPTDLTALEGDEQVQLSWSEPLNVGGALIDHYVVYQGATPLPGTVDGTSTTITGLNNGQTYTFSVAAVNSVGEGPKSGSITATPLTVPSAPSGLYATPGDAQVVLAWFAPSDLGGRPITNYTIYRGLIEGAETLLTTLGNELTYTDLGLENGLTYYYKVSAVNEAGEGPTSSIQATPIRGPSAPLNLNASFGDSYVYLAWEAPLDDGGSPITNYQIWRNTTSGTEVFLIDAGLKLWFNDTSVSNGQTYFYVVKAENAAGAGASSNEVSAAPFGSAPSIPENFVAEAGNELVNISWDAPSYTGPGPTIYHLFRGGVEIWNGTSTSYVDLNVSKGVAYSYTIAAQNDIGWSPNSTAILATPYGVPDAPWDLTVTPGNSTLSIAWNPVNYTGPGQLVYHLFRNGTELANGTFFSYLDEGLVNGVSYSYTVAASNSLGWSDNSTLVMGTPRGPPTAPRNLEAVPGDSNVFLSWDAPEYGPGTLIYHLYRNDILVYSGLQRNYRDTGLVNDVTYLYRVSAENDVGRGVNSTAVEGIPSATAQILPGPPENLEAEAGDNGVTLTWDEPSNPGSADITSYRVYRGTSADNLKLLAVVTGTNYLDEFAVTGQEYHYKVSAVSSVGESDLSPEVVSTPGSDVVASDNNTMLIIVVAVLAVLGGLGAFLFIRRKKN